MAKQFTDKTIKKFEDLNVIDNFMFNELEMQADREKAEQFVRILLETILQKKVTEIRIFSQFTEQGRTNALHGVQMDSYIEACVGEGEDGKTMILPIKPEVFDIEPNTYETDSEEKRMRYYRALIDTKILAAGIRYQDMKNVTLIMISNYDPFKCDRMVYTIENTCKEEPELRYDDGVRTLFLYTYGRRGAENNKELADLLRYMTDSRRENVTNPNIEFIQGMLEQIKQNAEIGVRYMQSWEIKQRFRDEGYGEGYGEGYDEGYDEGRCRTLVDSVDNAIKNFRLDVKTACEGLGITVEIYENAKLFLARVHEES
ncbi:MAG: hypothetical protein J6M66_08090 [Lachnospiraceae bacterium]|nr:hypothetical protein [Lachnospiraceae bacterium]